MAVVTLTEHGAKIYNEKTAKMREVYKQDGFKAGDVYRAPLWDVMHMFGEHLWMGNPRLPFLENDIVIEHEEPGDFYRQKQGEVSNNVKAAMAKAII